MRRLVYLSIAAALAAAGSTPLIAQETIVGPRVGSLDCRFTTTATAIPMQPIIMRCTLFPAPHGGPSILTGRLGGLGGVVAAKALVLPRENRRAVWYVTSTLRLLNLGGEYVRAPSGRERLERGHATKLYPAADVAFEDVGPNFAFGASRLTLQAQ
jgi:hypothetical protein